ncbi:plastocyanin/azurin family copper-binding protein [Paraburkholderia sp.]|uniref:plastocyanin/azurin family copper-binding protein n=1 Tax=Paraburkholderia sp. TaxID=1926495 RepID=UPI0023869D0F|nr:plastocyanin/azurin family copper-binding protein [Paraburkholderia sp.]MDE1181017.1 cupredoxin domain-containing protein [Paraburkholderia sp.]
MNMSRLFQHALMRTVCPALIACATVATAPIAQAQSVPNTVVIDNFTFNPPVLHVSAGSTVTWQNHDDMPHMIVSSATPRAFSSPPVDSGEHYTTTFAKPGTYAYFCSMHPRMTGTVIVK